MTTTNGQCLCGAIRWEFRGAIAEATICNCSACRRYAALWAYGDDGHEIRIDDPGGLLTAYTRSPRSPLSFDFCRSCGNLVSWRGTRPNEDGRTRAAVNLRLADPEAVANVRLRRFDGLDSFEDLPLDGRVVADAAF